METVTKPSILRNLFVKTFLICLLVISFRFAYIVTIRGESCEIVDFCFSSPEILASVKTDGEAKPVSFYTAVFRDLMSENFLTRKSKSLCFYSVGGGEDVTAMKELGVSNSIGVSDIEAKPLVKSFKKSNFNGNIFDFVFSGRVDETKNVTKFAHEIGKLLKQEGYLVIHTKSNDTYSLHSFINLFDCCIFIRYRDLPRFVDTGVESVNIHEIVMKKEDNSGVFSVNDNDKCLNLGFKDEIVRKAEPLIGKEPLKPWITLKRNLGNIKYLTSMIDISFKSRYVYVDVGSRSYGSSIGSWFRKQYPKQNKSFEIYAIEADKSFHDEYSAKKKYVKLLPYAAWVRNETLFFEVNHDPGDDPEEKGTKGRGMGRIKPVQSDDDGRVSSGVDKIIGFDFAEWLKRTVTKKDFVVMKMDVEETEFDLIPRLFETGAICLIDEIFLECHYNRWQRCCPGQRSAKYKKTYGQCLDLFKSLRDRGVLVHQWW